METGRVEAFSDGVFAIAITLLVLELHVDSSALDHPWRALADEWPSYLAYATSFVGNGRNATTSSSNRFRKSRTRSARSIVSTNV